MVPERDPPCGLPRTCALLRLRLATPVLMLASRRASVSTVWKVAEWVALPSTPLLAPL